MSAQALPFTLISPPRPGAECRRPALTSSTCEQYMDTLQRAVSAIQDCEKPVVAAVHGICFGAGLDLVSACDIRLCAENTTFSIKVRTQED